jgi:hypothetical protein
MSHLKDLARENLQTVTELLPEHVKTAARNHQHHHLMAEKFGINDFSIKKIAEYFGGRIAARHMKWRPVQDGLQALRNLRD